jgi:anti-anti-sigma factor
MFCRELSRQTDRKTGPIVGVPDLKSAQPPVTSVQKRTSRGTPVLWLDDAFRAPVTGELRHRVHELLRRGERHIVLNMARVSSIDAAGVGELVRAHNVTVAANSVLRIAQATAWVREVLTRAGLFHLLSGGGRDRLPPGASSLQQ